MTLNSSAAVANPVGSSKSNPSLPIVVTITPARNGPRKEPTFPPEVKMLIDLPLEVALALVTVENAGGWKAAWPKPAVPTARRSRL